MRSIAVFAAWLFTIPLCFAEPRPLWELGAGVATLNAPDYRGANQSSTYVLPFPYLIYRGEFLQADRNGIRGILFAGERVQLNLSLNGTLPANSDDNEARRGMADLKPTVELGPTLNVNLLDWPERNIRLDFRAPVRTAITVESSPRQIGWLFSPNLYLDMKDPPGMAGWRLGMVSGPIFGSRKYHAHFYSVSAAEATPARPAYTAAGGYSGSQVTLTLSRRFPRYWVGGFVRYDTVAGAVFDDSPLVRKRGAMSAGVAVSWIFGQSSRLVDVKGTEE